MKISEAVATLAVIAAGAAMAILVARVTPDGEESEEHGRHDHHDPRKEDAHRGPRGGRLLEDGDFAAEITIFERGVPPELRVYFYERGEPVDPTEVQLSLELHRLGESPESFRFMPRGDYALGDRIVAEPHSFDVSVLAHRTGRTHRWNYASYEGRIELDDEVVERAGITVRSVGPATLRTTIRLTGRVTPNEDRLAHVVPRFPGIVKKVFKRLGDTVGDGEVLAVVQSNESLQEYEVRSQLDGTVIAKRIAPGEFVDDDRTVYVIADLRTVWIDLEAYHDDFSQLAMGQPVLVHAENRRPAAAGRITYLSPVGAPGTQTLLVRSELPNRDGTWQPGLFVSADVIVDESPVPLAVKPSALQTFRDMTVVFLRVGDVFEARPVEIGRREEDWVEIASGLRRGQRYAAENSFVLKADLGKAGATHDH